jgi:hypothetical protein
MKFGEHIGVQAPGSGRHGGLDEGSFRFAPGLCLVVAARGELKGRLSDQSQRLGHFSGDADDSGYGMGVRQDNWSEGRFRCRWLRNAEAKYLKIQTAPSAAEPQPKPRRKGITQTSEAQRFRQRKRTYLGFRP